MLQAFAIGKFLFETSMCQELNYFKFGNVEYKEKLFVSYTIF